MLVISKVLQRCKISMYQINTFYCIDNTSGKNLAYKVRNQMRKSNKIAMAMKDVIFNNKRMSTERSEHTRDAWGL